MVCSLAAGILMMGFGLLAPMLPEYFAIPAFCAFSGIVYPFMEAMVGLGLGKILESGTSAIVILSFYHIFFAAVVFLPLLARKSKIRVIFVICSALFLLFHLAYGVAILLSLPD